jgi:type I restriction enzyme S subunit
MAKQIELPTPTKVPKNWCWMELGKLTSMKSGYPFDSKRFTKEKNSTTRPLIRIRDVVKGKTETYTDQDCPEEYIIRQGEILIGMDGDFNVAKWQSEDALLNQRVCCIKSSSPLYLNDFLFYYLPDPLKKINDATPSVTVKHLSTKTLAITPVPVPPFSEQQRIVDRIESLFAKLDEAKQKAQDALDSFETRKAAILHKAFTGELTARWRKEHGVGMESWETKKYSEICNIVRGGSPRPAGSPEFYGGNIPFMKVADITRNTGPYVNSTEYTIKEAGLKKTRMVDRNTLLLTNSGATLGVPAICTFQTTFNDGIAAFLGLNPDTLLFHYYFWTSKTADLRAINKGAAQPNLNTDIIGNIEINLPTEKEQTEIVRILDDLLAKEQEAKEAAESVLEQIDLMKKSILARAFRGELGTNDPREESSIELLKRSFLETIEKVKPKQVTEPKAEVIFVRKTIMEALSNGVRLTPENLKSETGLPIDDFYAQLKELIDKGSVVESRENGESYLEAENENRQTEN